MSTELEHKVQDVLQQNAALQKSLDERIAAESRMRKDMQDLSDALRRLERGAQRSGTGNLGLAVGSGGDFHPDVKRIEWTIPNIMEKMEKTSKGESLWSAEFGAMGINGIQLEFFPNGRESTTIQGFCSLFLWCPSGTKIKYQLSVGNHLRAPDEDTYDGRMGHGHSNFCNLAAEMVDGQVTVAVDILDVERAQSGGDITTGTLKVISGFTKWQVRKEAELMQNKSIERVEWKLTKISEKLKNLPRGSSIYSQLFSAAGIREILLEFYPNGSQNTTKDGFCAFYIRCPEGTSIVVTLFVGGYKKGPIAAAFDGSAGKGLPDFCDLQKEIRENDDSVVVGLHIQNPNLADFDRRTLLEMQS